jgi:orotate phosphoribosyltransferase-like protein
MVERFVPPDRPVRNELPSFDTVDQELARELELVCEQLEIIAPSLRDLAHRIEQMKPDTLVFLDKSARIFGTPYLQYLTATMGDTAPAVRFYNDTELKSRYLFDLDKEDILEQDFEQLRGKNVVFVDETFSTGKGAVALYEAAVAVGAYPYYAALSQDPQPESVIGDRGTHHDISEELHVLKVDDLMKQGKMIIYDNPIRNLFSRFASRLYIDEAEGKTVPLTHYKQSAAKSTNNIPDANTYVTPPDAMTMAEYEAGMTKRIYAYVRVVKAKIRETLEDNN